MIKEVQHFLNHANQVIFGKEEEILLALTCLLAKGHLLIEDVPGVGKTTMAKLFSKSLGLKMSRVQFTNDLLPMDLLGGHIFSKKDENFHFHPGPIFCNILLADELNRANPKTQSALLQVMEEYYISVDGSDFTLPTPFFVMATQNPRDQIGTHPLPESQLERFLMKINLGFPSRQAERELLLSEDSNKKILNLPTLIEEETFSRWNNEIQQVFVSDAILDYILDIINASREDDYFTSLSPRSTKDLLKASKAWAFLNERDHLIPDDIKKLSPYVLGHRLTQNGSMSANSEIDITNELLKKVRL